jgi:hypothetical protein
VKHQIIISRSNPALHAERRGSGSCAFAGQVPGRPGLCCRGLFSSPESTSDCPNRAGRELGLAGAASGFGGGRGVVLGFARGPGQGSIRGPVRSAPERCRDAAAVPERRASARGLCRRRRASSGLPRGATTFFPGLALGAHGVKPLIAGPSWRRAGLWRGGGSGPGVLRAPQGGEVKNKAKDKERRRDANRLTHIADQPGGSARATAMPTTTVGLNFDI